MLQINYTNSNFNFKSGLNGKTILQEKLINTAVQEKIFANKYGVEAQFLNNKSSALANKLCMNIFQDLSKNLSHCYSLPPAITTYNASALIDEKSPVNFCVPDTKKVLKHDYPFPGRSIFFRNFHNLDEINNISEQLFQAKISSSPHFLAPFIHEWIHSFHLDYIYKTFGYGGTCNYLKENYPDKPTQITGVQLLKCLETKKISPQENEIIYDTLGQYSTKPVNQYPEIFSETATKCICDSLDGYKLVKNPFEVFKKLHPDFQKIFKKICMFN